MHMTSVCLVLAHGDKQTDEAEQHPRATGYTKPAGECCGFIMPRVRWPFHDSLPQGKAALVSSTVLHVKSENENEKRSYCESK
jgi:hypothetical protein